MFQDGVNRVVHHVQKDLLELVRIGGRHGEILRQVQMDTDVVHAQVIITQCQGLLQGLIDLHRDALRLVLAGKAKEVLHDAVGTLGLLIKFVGVLDSLLSHLSAGGQQLAVAEDGGQRVVQFVSDSGNQLPDRCQLLAMEQLLLSTAQVFISLASLLIEIRAFNGAGNLAAHRDEQVDVRRRKLPRGAAADDQAAYNPVFGPQDHDVSGQKSFSCLNVAKNLRECQTLYGKERRVRSLNALHQLRFHGDGRKILSEFRTMSDRHNALQLGAFLFEQIE